MVGTCDGTTSRVYINSKVVGEGPGHFVPAAAGANVVLGFGEDRSDYDESFNGLMDEIHILTRGLTADQVQDIAQGIVPAFTKAREPNPANGATGVQMPLFRWTAGDNAKFHNIYMGASDRTDGGAACRSPQCSGDVLSSDAAGAGQDLLLARGRDRGRRRHGPSGRRMELHGAGPDGLWSLPGGRHH